MATSEADLPGGTDDHPHPKHPVGAKVALSGACCTGPAISRLTGTTQQALVVETPAWAPMLDRLCDFAERHNTFVCPKSMTRDVVEVATRTIAALTVPTHARGDPVKHLLPVEGPAGGLIVPVAEVLSEVEQKDDEWMYVLEKMEKDAAKGTPNSAMTAAVEACLAGDLAAARQAVTGAAEDRSVARPSTVHWLNDVLRGSSDARAFVAACDALL